MLQGRNSLALGDNFAAIDALNKLLLLPPNNYTQDGQEWVGVARERAGQLDKAKVEFDLYLKLYKTPEGVTRIKARLTSLGSKPPKTVSATTDSGSEKQRPSQTIAYGSVSMHYYNGKSQYDTIDNANQFSSNLSQSSFSGVDQSALLSSIIASERFISDKYDNRIVFQGTSYTNYLPGQTGQTRLGAAYFEVKNKLIDYSVRLGRQSSNGGGVLGRFDGAAVGYGLSPSIRLNAVAGQLSDYNVGSAPVFYGASVDIGSVSFFAINQTIDGLVERRAVGADYRYFETNKSAFLTLDYDVIFSALNVMMFQGSYTETPERAYNLFLDHRRSPYLSLRNALYGANTSSITDLLQQISEDEVRALAYDRTGTSNLIQLGVTQQLTPRWQIGGDFRISNYESLPASGKPVDIFADPNSPPPIQGFYQETPSSGNDWAISPQLIGNNLFSSQDVTVLSLSYMGSPQYTGQSMYVYSRANFTDKWSIDLSLQYYRQNFESGTTTSRFMPTLRTAYQVRQSISLDVDFGFEVSHTETGTQITDGSRQFYSLGFRWDF